MKRRDFMKYTGALYEGETFSHQIIFEESMKFIRDNKDGPFFWPRQKNLWVNWSSGSAPKL